VVGTSALRGPLAERSVKRWNNGRYNHARSVLLDGDAAALPTIPNFRQLHNPANFHSFNCSRWRQYGLKYVTGHSFNDPPPPFKPRCVLIPAAFLNTFQIVLANRGAIYFAMLSEDMKEQERNTD
jgi:hypothetical protein